MTALDLLNAILNVVEVALLLWVLFKLLERNHLVLQFIELMNEVGEELNRLRAIRQELEDGDGT